jgi:allantoinase
MSASGVDEFAAADDLTLLEGMARAASLGLPVAVHAESDAITGRLAARAVAEGRTAMRDYLASRPVVAELEAIGRAITLARETGCALHVVHVSSAAGVAAVTAARAAGVDATCETCPHYLLLSEDDLERLGTLAKCAPPLRDAGERDALLAELRRGRIDFVATDHSPCPPAMKAGGFDVAWGGIAGAQTLLATVLTARLDAAELVAAAPARRLRLPGKGRLEPGYDADLALIAPGEHVLRREDLHDRHRANPLAGRTFHARVVRTLVRGRTVFQDGRIVADGGGRLITPTPRGTT